MFRNNHHGMGGAPRSSAGGRAEYPEGQIQLKRTRGCPSGIPERDDVPAIRARKTWWLPAWTIAAISLSAVSFVAVSSSPVFAPLGGPICLPIPPRAPVVFPRKTFEGHTHFIWCVTFSPDGSTLASGSNDNTVKLWDASTGKTITTLQGHTGPVYTVSFSPDGTTLASASTDGTLKLWDLAAGKDTVTLPAHPGGARCATFSPDGTLLVSGGEDNVVRLWDIATGKHTVTLQGHSERVASVAFSPDGRTVASGSWDNTARIWDVATGLERATLRGHTSWVLSVAFTPNGKRLASASSDNTIRIWEVVTAKNAATFHGGPNQYDGNLAFSPDGRTLASTRNWEATARLWDVARSRVTTTLQGHMDAVWSVAFSPDGKTLATASLDKTIKLWDVPPTTKTESAQSDAIAPSELERLWAMLAEEDAARAYESIKTLVGAAKQSVPLVNGRLRPSVGPNGKQATKIADWITDLNSDKFTIRQEASDELERVGGIAEAALRKALADKPSLEVRLRIEKLLTRIDKDLLQGWRALEVLETIGTPEAKQVLELLTTGAESSGLTREARASVERLKKLDQ